MTMQEIRVLSGSEAEVRKYIGERRKQAGTERRYEAASRLRDVLFAVKRAEERRSIWGEPKDFYDALGFARSAKQAIVMVIPVRAGRVLGGVEYKRENEREGEPAEAGSEERRVGRRAEAGRSVGEAAPGGVAATGFWDLATVLSGGSPTPRKKSILGRLLNGRKRAVGVSRQEARA